MKKLIAIAALLISSVATFAQQPVGSFSIQPKVGLNIASLTKTDDADPRFGLVAGAEFMYQASDMLGVSFGALYSMQGCTGTTNELGKDVDVTFKLDYINIPILANVYVAPGFAVKLGLQPAFCINNKIKGKSGGSSVEIDGDKLSLDENTFDLSMPIGLSYEFSNFVIEGRYNFGLTKAYKDVDSKNSVFQFTVGYKLPL